MKQKLFAVMTLAGALLAITGCAPPPPPETTDTSNTQSTDAAANSATVNTPTPPKIAYTNQPRPGATKVPVELFGRYTMLVPDDYTIDDSRGSNEKHICDPDGLHGLSIRLAKDSEARSLNTLAAMAIDQMSTMTMSRPESVSIHEIPAQRTILSTKSSPSRGFIYLLKDNGSVLEIGTGCHWSWNLDTAAQLRAADAIVLSLKRK